MNARVGRLTELEALLDEAQKRTLMGDARVKISAASEGAWMMRHQPGVAFRCGPFAVINVARAKTPEIVKKKMAAFLEKTQSPTVGFSIPEVQRMSAELGLDLQIAKRDIGAAVIVPAVVHWKVGHFAAILRDNSKGKFVVKDPTFGQDDIAISAKAIDREASGYFLVPAGPLPSGWSPATVSETASLYGRGYASEFDPNRTAKWDHKVGGLCQPAQQAMAAYRFHTLTSSVHIEDTLISYAPAFGPPIDVTVAYNQREANQPTSIDYTNFGPQFVSSWLSFYARTEIIQLTAPGGGSYSWPSGGGSLPGNPLRGERSEEPSANVLRLTYPDGRVELYEQYIPPPPGSDGPGRTFLSRVVDAQGNEAVIEYDDEPYPSRILRIVDATGGATDFHYDYPDEPYLVTSIDDPYSRTATFAYSLTAGKVRLQSTEDPNGIVSSFTYNEAGEVVAMTTPYGTTTFKTNPPYQAGDNLIRFIEATDPLGQTERLEYNGVTPAAAFTALDSLTPTGMETAQNFNQYRTSFYWDKLLYKIAPGDYSKARLYHWVHQDNNKVTGIVESERAPLEDRVYYNYPGQVDGPSFPGTVGYPSVVGRIAKDALGANQSQLTKVTDPLARETSMTYASNAIDVVAVKQKTNSGDVTVASYTYGGGAPQHRPATVTDGAGKTTTFTYSSTGQVLTITNAKSEVTTFTYETSTSSPDYRRLLSITGDVPGGNRTFTYDVYGRVRTATDSESYTLTFDYDVLDRVRTLTFPDGSFQQFEYEDHSLVATRDRAGRWTRHTFNANEERVVTQDPSLRTTQFQWCRCGELRRFVDGNGNLTEWERDVGSRVTKRIQANGLYDAFTYDLSGRLATTVNALAATVTYSYNVDDRLAKVDYSDTATPDVTYAYDTRYPRLTSRVDGSGTTTFTYHPDGASTNGAGQVALVNGPLSNDTLKHTYDELGRLKKLQIVDDATQTTASYSEEYTFDARSRVTNVVNNLGTATYAYVGQTNRPSTVTNANGMQTQFDYFGATSEFVLKQIKNLSSGGTPTVISQFDYTYTQDRSIATWKVDQGSGAKTWTFGYDDSRQLTSAVLHDATPTLLESYTYAYDKAGNRIQVGNGTSTPKNNSVNNLNQLLAERDHGTTTFAGIVNEPARVTVNGKPAKMMSTDGGAPYKFEALVDLDAGSNTVVVQAKDGQNNTSTKTYAVTATGDSKKYIYDQNGNLRYETLPNNTTLREFRWDQPNRLVKELHGTHESAYEYDGESRRVKITEKENGTQTKQETFVWCGSRICQKRNGSTIIRSYFGNGFQGSGTTNYFYTRDHLGSVREVIGTNGSTVSSRLAYDPWGKVTETGSPQSDFAYTGHYADRATGLNLTRFRGYDALLGRWLSTDPIGLVGGLNLYGYVNNDPVNSIDPLGLDPFGGGEAVVESQWDASPEERQSWDQARGIGAGLGMVALTGVAAVQALVLRIGATATATATGTAGAAGDKCSTGGWQAFLGEAAKRVADTAARHGNSNAVAISRKVALTRLEGLTPRVEQHLAKLAADPNNTAANHWRYELRGWLLAMERVLPAIGDKTGEAWAERIAAWRNALGD